MIVSIDLEVLKEHYITPDDYVFLWGIFHNINLENIEIYPNFVQLQEKGLAKEGENWIITNLGREIFEPKGIEQQFLEFWTTYPIKVMTEGGKYRFLRDSNHTTKQAQTCLKKYEAILKNSPRLHKTIMKGLHNYLKNTELRFIVGIEVFLNQQRWNRYLEFDEDIEDTNEMKI